VRKVSKQKSSADIISRHFGGLFVVLKKYWSSQQMNAYNVDHHRVHGNIALITAALIRTFFEIYAGKYGNYKRRGR